MISSASTLLLATLVFNAASVFGAPLRYPDVRSETVARAEISAPVQPVARAAIVDVQPVRQRSNLGSINRRSARLVSERETSSEYPEARDTLDNLEPVEKRETEQPQRRYPRRVYHEFYEKRSPEPVTTREAEQPQRRYPRRVYHDLYEKRSPEPATTIKETTLVITKTTVHDTPADAAALNPPPATGGAPPPVVPPVVPGTGTESTIVSLSQTVTLNGADAAKATPATTTTSTAGTEVTGTNGATVTIGGDSAPTPPPVAGAVVDTPPPAAGAPGDAPPPASSDAAGATTTATTTSATETSTGTPTSTASTGDATPATDATKPADDKPAPDAPADDKSPGATTGDDKTPPATDPTAATDKTPPATTDTPPAAPADGGADPAAAESRRAVKASNQPIMRRLAFSGASWATAIRRQVNQR